MNVSLTPELDNFVIEKVHSASEVIRDGLRLLQERDQLHHVRLAKLRADIQVGNEQLKHGQYTEYTGETDEEITDKLRTDIHNMITERTRANT
jgi:antitoxin ParD1/3/4